MMYLPRGILCAAVFLNGGFKTTFLGHFIEISQNIAYFYCLISSNDARNGYKDVNVLFGLQTATMLILKYVNKWGKQRKGRVFTHSSIKVSAVRV